MRVSVRRCELPVEFLERYGAVLVTFVILVESLSSFFSAVRCINFCALHTHHSTLSRSAQSKIAARDDLFSKLRFSISNDDYGFDGAEE